MTSKSVEGKLGLGVGERVFSDPGYFESQGFANKREQTFIRRRYTTLLNALSELRDETNGFDTSVSGRILKVHQSLHQIASHPLSPLQLPEFHRFDSAYWDIPYEPESGKVFSTHISPQLEVWSGKLSSFDLGLRALVVDMAMRVYASELLQTAQLSQTLLEQEGITESTRNFPELLKRKKAELEAQLLLAMSHSFREDYVLAVAFAKPDGADGPRHLVGSIGAVQGNTERTLEETIGWDGSEKNTDQAAIISSLPTNMALTYILNAAGAEAARTPENQIAEITRLNVAPRQTCEQLGIKERGKLSQTLMYIIHHAIQAHMPEVEWELFNTQEPLHRVIRQLGLPAEVIAEDSSIHPTQLVSNSIHGHYFQRTPPIPQLMRVDEAAKVAGEHFYLK